MSEEKELNYEPGKRPPFWAFLGSVALLVIPYKVVESYGFEGIWGVLGTAFGFIIFYQVYYWVTGRWFGGYHLWKD